MDVGRGDDFQVGRRPAHVYQIPDQRDHTCTDGRTHDYFIDRGHWHWIYPMIWNLIYCLYPHYWLSAVPAYRRQSYKPAKWHLRLRLSIYIPVSPSHRCWPVEWCQGAEGY